MAAQPRLRLRWAAVALAAIAVAGAGVVAVGSAVRAPGVSVTSEHHHGAGVQDSEPGEHGSGAADHNASGHSGPIAVTASDADRAKAAAIVASTTSATAEYSDVAVAEAAGYRWIGDGLEGGEYRHYVQPAYLLDDLELDPAHIESLVYRVGSDGALELASGMYILRPGTTVDDAPDVAGDLTEWHIHTNLCWSRGGIAGTNDSGACPAGSVNAVTPPMLHVWVIDNPDGPFAAIDENGIVSAHAH